MFSEKEIKKLKKLSSKKIRIIVYSVLVFSAITSLVSGITDLIRSHNFAQLIELSVYDIFNRWINNGFNASETYSGIYCIAFEKFISALFDLYLSVFIFLTVLICRVIIKRNQKIIQLFETKTNPTERR